MDLSCYIIKPVLWNVNSLILTIWLNWKPAKPSNSTNSFLNFIITRHIKRGRGVIWLLLLNVICDFYVKDRAAYRILHLWLRSLALWTKKQLFFFFQVPIKLCKLLLCEKCRQKKLYLTFTATSIYTLTFLRSLSRSRNIREKRIIL